MVILFFTWCVDDVDDGCSHSLNMMVSRGSRGIRRHFKSIQLVVTLMVTSPVLEMPRTCWVCSGRAMGHGQVAGPCAPHWPLHWTRGLCLMSGSVVLRTRRTQHAPSVWEQWPPDITSKHGAAQVIYRRPSDGGVVSSTLFPQTIVWGADLDGSPRLTSGHLTPANRCVECECTLDTSHRLTCHGHCCCQQDPGQESNSKAQRRFLSPSPLSLSEVTLTAI